MAVVLLGCGRRAREEQALPDPTPPTTPTPDAAPMPEVVVQSNVLYVFYPRFQLFVAGDVVRSVRRP